MVKRHFYANVKEGIPVEKLVSISKKHASDESGQTSCVWVDGLEMGEYAMIRRTGQVHIFTPGISSDMFWDLLVKLYGGSGDVALALISIHGKAEMDFPTVLETVHELHGGYFNEDILTIEKDTPLGLTRVELFRNGDIHVMANTFEQLHEVYRSIYNSLSLYQNLHTTRLRNRVIMKTS